MPPRVPDDVKPSRLVYPALDGLRGIAVLLVMVHNLTILDADVSMVEKLWVFVTDAGWIGVQLFFVLSGFLITGILVDDRDRPRFYRDFYLRRVLRIFPLYYAVLAVRIAIVPLIEPTATVPIDVALWFVLYLSNWSVAIDQGTRGLAHFWSLAVEEQFYLAWPFAVRRFGLRGLAWCCGAIVAAASIARLVVYVEGFDRHWLYMSTLTRADAIAFGALVALAVREPGWRTWLARNYTRIGVVASAGLAVVVAHAHGLSRLDTWIELVGYSLLAILFACAIALIALDATRSRPGFAMWPVLRTAGKYSYAAYVFHTPLKVIVMYYANPWMTAHGVHDHAILDMAFVSILIAMSFVCARLSYAILEQPLLRLKDRWAPRR